MTQSRMAHKYKQRISDLVGRAVGLSSEEILPFVDWTKSRTHGDFSVAIPRLVAKAGSNEKPASVAQKLAKEIPRDDMITSAEAAGVFVNFRVNPVAFTQDVIREILDKKDTYGHTSTGGGRSVVVDFSSPNIAKPFHAGHLRSTIIGNFVCNISRTQGYRSVGINYLGDWGKQYGLLALGYSQFGDETKLQTEPIRHLFDVYVKVNQRARDDESIHDAARQYFKRMEDGDEDALRLWRQFRELSIGEYEKMYQRLNVRFDAYEGESLVGADVPGVIESLRSNNLLRIDQGGSEVADLTDQKLDVAVIKKKDGTALYLTRDIATAIRRHKKYDFAHMYYVVGTQQGLHFKQLFALLQGLGYHWAKNCHHIGMGMVQGMSTRRGDVVFLEDILNEARDKMLEHMHKNKDKLKGVENPEETASQVGLSAVVIQDLQSTRSKGYRFSWDRILRNDGDTGPYLQYQHVRLCSIQRVTGIHGNTNDLSPLVEPEALQLVHHLAMYPEALSSAHRQMEACVVVQYAFRLAQLLSVAHERLFVKGQPAHIAEARMALFESARITLASTLRIVGLTPLHQM
eukprot:comp20304_c0_seq1/m.25512 comp20304_c0_seq1/g.25512  ORF comp20304_c0_seq1/g.25512 comp20304_c0_seq1/m.25512 type:complete len:573 (-) comp20304_c0_seq1:7-1725(-)